MPNYAPYEYEADTTARPDRNPDRDGRHDGHAVPLDPADTRRLDGYLWCLAVGLLALIVACLVLFLGGRSIFFSDAPRSAEPDAPTVDRPADEKNDRPFADGKEGNALLPRAEDAVEISAIGLNAANVALADLSRGAVTATYRADESIYPASMTKVMTLLVVVENLPSRESLQETITISKEVYDEMVRQESSGISLQIEETMTVEALLYALMLKSDGIAACELARYIAGSEAAFVDLMNRKAVAMGLSGTHFENPTGLYHPDHRSTARDIASIMAYAMDMQLCRRIMTAEVFKTQPVNSDGKSYQIYNSLLVHQFEDTKPNQPTGLKVIAGKTGYVPESGYCLVTYAEATDGRRYVCVTAGGTGKIPACIADYITVYNAYA